MIDKVLANIREELLGAKPLQASINDVTRDPNSNDLFPTLTNREDPFVWMHGMVLFLIHLMYHGLFDKIEDVLNSNQLHRAEILKVSELSFDFAFQRNQFQVCFKMLDFFGLDAGRTTKIVSNYICEYLDRKEYQKASELWNTYQNRGIPEKTIMEYVEKAFKRVSDFRSTDTQRNYKPMFQLVELFNIPRPVTHWTGIEQYNYTMQNRDYYMAALIAKKLRLPASHINKAGFEAFKHTIIRVRENIARGSYKENSSLSPGDPYYIAKSLIEEFNLFDFKTKEEKKDTSIIKKISEMAYDLFVDVFNIGESSGNAPIVIYSLGIQILRDFQLMNDMIHFTVAQNTQNIIGKFIDTIAITLKEKVDVKAYYPIMKELRSVYRGDYARLDPLIINLTSKALAQKEIELANKFNLDFHFPLHEIRQTVLDLILEWMNHGDFDSILLVLKYFPFYDDLKNNKLFMTELINYYKETVKSQKILKSLTIAEAFHLERSLLLEPVRLYVQELLNQGNVEEAKKFIRKYHLRRKEYLPVVKGSYITVLQSSKQLAGRFRSELKLSIFDVGLKNWLLYEVLGLSYRGPQNKNAPPDKEKTKSIMPSE